MFKKLVDGKPVSFNGKQLLILTKLGLLSPTTPLFNPSEKEILTKDLKWLPFENTYNPSFSTTLTSFEALNRMEREGYSVIEQFCALVRSSSLLKQLGDNPFEVNTIFPEWNEKLLYLQLCVKHAEILKSPRIDISYFGVGFQQKERNIECFDKAIVPPELVRKKVKKDDIFIDQSPLGTQFRASLWSFEFEYLGAQKILGVPPTIQLKASIPYNIFGDEFDTRPIVDLLGDVDGIIFVAYNERENMERSVELFSFLKDMLKMYVWDYREKPFIFQFDTYYSPEERDTVTKKEFWEAVNVDTSLPFVESYLKESADGAAWPVRYICKKILNGIPGDRFPNPKIKDLRYFYGDKKSEKKK